MTDWPRLPSPGIVLDDPRGPRSARFGDGYASAAGAVAEGKAVFLDPVGVPDLWLERPHTTIGELGFGLGLNFLLTWGAWRDAAPPHGTLSYVAVEYYPVDRAALAHALDAYRAELGDPLIDTLTSHWPLRHPGFHRIDLEGGRIALTLILAEAADGLRQLTTPMDAWYLDGFAPAKNPEMWRDDVLDQLARLSRPGTCAATYSAASAVRKGLAARGFEVRKEAGFAGKRDRTVAVFSGIVEGTEDALRHADPAPWYRPMSVSVQPGGSNDVAVLGGGIAGQCMAAALRARGIDIRHFDRQGAKGGLTGNPAALLAPRLHAGPTLPGRWQAASFLHALRLYDALAAAGHPVWLHPRGVHQRPQDDRDATRQESILRALDWPDALIRRAPDGDGLIFPTAGLINPDAVRDAISPAIETADIAGIERTGDGWCLRGSDGAAVWEGAALVVAAGAWSARLLDIPALSIRPSRGQVSFVEPAPIDIAVSRGGYLTPALPAGEVGPLSVLGSSFAAETDPDDPRWHGWQSGDHADYASTFSDMFNGTVPEARGGWVGIRGTLPDRLPLAGPVPDVPAFLAAYDGLRHGKQADYPPAPVLPGLFILAGMGARGYQFAPLAAALVADLVAGRTLPVERDLAEALHPARFIIRALTRNEKVQQVFSDRQ